MIRRSLLTFVALVALGAVIDGSVHREHVGEDTVGALERRGAEATGRPIDRTVPTPTDLARAYFEEHYGPYLALDQHAPGAVVLQAADADRDGLWRPYLVGIAGASEVRTVELGDLELPGPATFESGASEKDPWTLRVAPGRVSAVLVTRDAAGTHLVDVRTLPREVLSSLPADVLAGSAEDAGRAPSRPAPPTLRRAIAGETLVLIVLMVAGGLLLPRSRSDHGQGGWGAHVSRVSMGLVVGIALHVTVGLLLLPGPWALAATIAVSLLTASIATRKGIAVGWGRGDAKALVAASLGIFGIVAVARDLRSVHLITDSFRYWAGGAAHAVGAFGLEEVTVKRGLGQQVLHSAGFTVGAVGLQALGVVLLAAAALTLLAVARKGATGARTPVVVAGALVVIALVASPQFWAMATFINSHLLVATLLLALVVLLGEGTDERARRALLPAVGVVIAAIVSLRPEGGLLVGATLLGLLAVRSPKPVWIGAWYALGASALVWAGLLTLGQGPSLATTLIAAMGGGALLVGRVVRSLRSSVRNAMPPIAFVVLWAIAIIMLTPDRVTLFDAVVANVGVGDGGWGVTGPLLLLTGLFAVAHTRGAEDVRTLVARSFVIGFVPITILAKLGDGAQSAERGLDAFLRGGGRVGWGDSVNRMWMHVALVLLLLFLEGLRRRHDPRAVTSHRRGRRAVDAAMDGALVVAGLVAVAQWAPGYVPRDVIPVTATVLSVDGAEPAGELVDGVEVRQSILLPTVTPEASESDVRPTALCTDLTFVTYARAVEGRVRVELEVGGRSAQRMIQGADLQDWVEETVCVDLTADEGGMTDISALDGGTLEVRVRGIGTRTGSSPSVLVDDADEFGSLLSILRADGTMVQRRSEHLAVDVRIEGERRLGPMELPIERSVLVLPWLALAVGAVSIVGIWRWPREVRECSAQVGTSTPSDA